MSFSCYARFAIHNSTPLPTSKHNSSNNKIKRNVSSTNLTCDTNIRKVNSLNLTCDTNIRKVIKGKPVRLKRVPNNPDYFEYDLYDIGSEWLYLNRNDN